MQSNSQLFGLNAFLGAIPKEGPKCIPETLDWSTGSQFVYDMVAIKQQGKLSGVQALFIDNSINDQPVSFFASIINQIITLPSGYQGYLPLLVSDQVKITFTSTGTKNTPIIFLNFPIAAAVWPALVPAGEIVFPNPANVTVVNSEGTATDKSGTITAGGASQQLAVANTNRNKIIIENIDPAEDLWVNDDGSAAAINTPGSWQIYAGGTFVTTSKSIITVNATTAGHKYTAKEY